MTAEEQLKLNNELLQQILLHTYANTDEENKAKQEEIDEIDESIERYQAEIDELKTKLADENNYKRTKSDFELKERPVIEELLSDSIAQEREDIFKSNQLYRKEQEQQTKMLGVYNGEVVKLKDEISIIEARLNKDAIAKKRGIAKKLHLSDDEVSHLQAEVAYKKELIEEGNQVMEICADEIRRYGRLITTNNERLKHITEKEQRLSSILSSKVTTTNDIDGYKIRLDRDELSKKLAALEAFENRKKYLLYDPSKEIRRQIEQNNEILNGKFVDDSKVNVQNNEERISKSIEQKQESEESKEEQTEKTSDDASMDEIIKEAEKHNPPKNYTRPDIKSVFDNLNNDNLTDEKNSSKDNNTNSTEKAEKGDSEFKPIPQERALELVEITDAPDNLKKQKLSEKFKNLWNKWRTKAIAVATAAALTITGGVGLFTPKQNSDSGDTKGEVSIEQPASNITKYDEDYFKFVERPTKFTTEDSEFEKLKDRIEKSEEEKNISDDKVIDKPSDAAYNPTPIFQPISNDNVLSQKDEEKVETPTVPSFVETPEIPEVEEEQPIKEEEKNDEEIKPEEPKLEGVINNGEIETTILQVDGEYVDIPLKNGDSVCVRYGDNGETVPSEITIKYVGTDMYIYSPVVNTKAL